MTLGILTEKGIVMTSAPVIADMRPLGLILSMGKSNSKMKDVKSKVKLLKELDNLKGRKAAKVQQEKESCLSDLIQILK
jgi:hypothetical protein